MQKNMRRLIVASGMSFEKAWPEEANKQRQFDSGTLNFDTKPIVEVLVSANTLQNLSISTPLLGSLASYKSLISLNSLRRT
jgi:hypothetical protein